MNTYPNIYNIDDIVEEHFDDFFGFRATKNNELKHSLVDLIQSLLNEKTLEIVIKFK